MNERRTVSIPLACLVALWGISSPQGVWAQSDDDLLDDLGGPVESETATSDAASDVDLDAPLEDTSEVEAVPTGQSSAGEQGEGDEGQAEEPKTRAVDPRSLDRVKAVPRKAVLKRGRLELAAYPGLSLNDAYYQHYATGGSLVFYPHDSFGIGVGAEYFLAHDRTHNVDIIRQAMTSVPAVFEPPKLFAHLDFYWVPIYGKFSLLGSSIMHFEIYASAGLGAATAFANRWPLAVNAAIGQRLMLGDWLAFRLEVRDHLFVDTLEVNGVPRSDMQSYLMLMAGVSVFIPPSFEYEIR